MGPLVIASSFRDSKHNGSQFTIMKIMIWPFGMTISKILGNLTVFSPDAASQSWVQNEKPCYEHATYAPYILVIPIVIYCHPIPTIFDELALWDQVRVKTYMKWKASKPPVLLDLSWLLLVLVARSKLEIQVFKPKSLRTYRVQGPAKYLFVVYPNIWYNGSEYNIPLISHDH